MSYRFLFQINSLDLEYYWVHTISLHNLFHRQPRPDLRTGFQNLLFGKNGLHAHSSGTRLTANQSFCSLQNLIAVYLSPVIAFHLK